MAFSFGFYNSLNGDRTYDAIDISRIFDGVITDGVFAGIGDLFAVTPGSGLQVGVGSGKAWFNHTWNRNDSIYLLSVEEPDITLSRIDAVYIKVDGRESIRANTLEIRKGSPAVEPQKPLITQNPDEGIYEHALAYVTVRAGVTQIEPGDIENVVGTEETPLVTSILQQTNIDSLWANWKAQFTDFLSENETEMDQWMSQTQTEFDEWWETIKSVLDTETATRLQNQIDELKTGKVDTSTYDEHIRKANAHSVGFGNLVHTGISVTSEGVNCNEFSTKMNPICLVNGDSAVNGPGLGYWYVHTIIYPLSLTTAMQIAYPYAGINKPIRFRNCYQGSWSQWTDVITTQKIQEILRTPGISNRIGDIHTTMRTDMGSNWLKCSGIPISETTYPNARAIIDPYYSRWPIGATLWKPFASGPFDGPIFASDGDGTYAALTNTTIAGTATIKYGSAPNSLTSTKTVTISSGYNACTLLYSSKIGWIIAAKTGNYSKTYIFYKASTISGSWSQISGSTSNSEQNAHAIIRVLDDGTLVAYGYTFDAVYCSNGASLVQVPVSDAYRDDVGSINYANNRYYTFWIDESNDYALMLSMNTIITAAGGTPITLPSDVGGYSKVFAYGSDVLLYAGKLVLYRITGTSTAKVSFPSQITDLKTIFPITKNGVNVLCACNSTTAYFLRYSSGTLTLLGSESITDRGTLSSSDDIVMTSSCQIGDYAFLVDSVKKIEPYTPVINASPATAYILAKELI